MSKLLIELKEDNSNLLQILEPYYKDIEEAAPRITIKGKTLAHANQEQPSWQSYYDERRISLHSLVKHFETLLDSKKGELWKKYTENHSRDLNSKDKEYYILNSPTYITYKQLLIEVQEIYSNFVAICDAYKMRGYALRNLTDLHVNSLQDVVV